jgi:phage tail sheath gpL-like
MATSIVSTPGVNNLTALPGSWLNLVFGAGPVNSATAPLTAVIIGDANGTATNDGTTIYGPDTTTSFLSLSQARTLFGTNSELTNAIKNFYDVNSVTPLYVIPINDHDSTKVGKCTIVIGGTSATLTNQLNVYVGINLFQVGINVGDTPTVIGANLQAAINMALQPFSALNTSGSVVISAGSAGFRNTPSVSVTLQTADSGSGGISITSTTTVAGTESTTLSTTMAAAISTLGNQKFYYQILLPSMDETSTTFTSTVEALAANLTTQAQPLNDNRSRGFISARMKSTDAIYATAFAS